ncbi:DUF3718 domain-containing protein [Alteromonas lipotrueiana]|uniref:DUF3718 domain-containing protein n=1 Tax=Alteromonas lipotrueiana TaxID=2803815 RepID=UPI001C49216F|nr:DUF3718 domain-containing protein [Alteromonas lipotrueiana]
MGILVKGLLASVAISCAFSVQADIETDLTNICHLVNTDDRSGFRKKIRTVEIDYRLKLQDYYEGITCNGHSLVRTAILKNSLGVGTLLVKTLPRNHLKSPEQDGVTLQAWVNQRGLQRNKIAKILQHRL